jgi:uncharacterized protein (DUF427 family)
MGLMTGTGPLGRAPAGRFNSERTLYLEPTGKRVRVIVGGETIADSRRVMMLHESGHQPVYYFPPDDVRAEFLEPSDRHTRCPKKGEASYWSVRVGDRVVQDGAWYYPDGPIGLAGLIAFYWNRMDHWLEEDEEVFVHPRDPYARVDLVRSDRHVRVSIEGELLAESRDAVALFETGLPPRWYLPLEDVLAELAPSDTVTRCPYKGTASYYSVKRADGTLARDLVWYYPEPFAEVGRIAGLMCFFNEQVDLELDGELQDRPATVWSTGVKPALNASPAETRG